jgi:hypothetical protein
VLFYLPLQLSQALVLTGLMAAGLGAALYLTRSTINKSELAEEPAGTVVHR